jgi:hypothetical protein
MIYRVMVIQEYRSVFWEVIVWVILRKSCLNLQGWRQVYLLENPGINGRIILT